MEMLNSLLSAGIGAGIMAIIQMCLQRKWAKEDKSDALVGAMKVLMQFEVRQIGNSYITKGEISLSDKEMVTEMHKAYKALGGNGHLDTVIHEIDHLKVVGD